MFEDDKNCFHCGLVNDSEKQYSLKINDQLHYLCCPGCKAVAESIISLGLEDYYQFREQLPETSPKQLDINLSDLDIYDHEKIQQKYVTEIDEHQSIDLMITGIVCAACCWLLESRISALTGISSVSINQSSNRAAITWDPELINLSSILKAITELGYQAQPYNRQLREQQFVTEKKSALKRLIVAGLGMMQVMMYSLGFYLDTNQEMSASTAQLLRWVSLLISSSVVFYSASPFYLSAIKSVSNIKFSSLTSSINMDVPVTLAIFSAWGASLYATIVGSGEVYFDSVSMFIFFLLTGRYLQMLAVHKTGRVLEERLNSRPETAIQVSNNQQQTMLLDDVEIDDHLLVKAGQKIPCDARIISGETSIDNSMLTGESVPKNCSIGDFVAAGAINCGSVITIKVTATAENSTLTSIINMMQTAQQSKPEIQLLANKIASYFVVSVLILAVATGVYWYHVDSNELFNAVLAVLVVTCPCALSLATPVAMTAGLGRLTEHSLLLNRSKALQNISELTDIVFDKTGTLTTGNFKFLSLSNYSDELSVDLSDDLSDGFTDKELLSIIVSLESYSEHPIASAFSNVFQDTQVTTFDVQDIKVIPSVGMSAVIDGVSWCFGNLSPQSQSHSSKSHSSQSQHLQTGQLCLYLLREGVCLASVIIETEIRPEAKSTIEQLKQGGFTIHLISGDNQANVEMVAKQLDIQLYHALQTPQTKLEYIQNLQAQGKKAAMIGDGINDSPAMASALVSFAIAKSSDLTKVSADIIMLAENLNLIVTALTISKDLRRIIKQNLFWALSYNLIGIPLAVSGYLTPWLAAAGMSLSSLMVVLNALRLTRK